MGIEIHETTNGFKVIREGFNGCGHIDIWCGTMDQALKIIEMVLEKEGGFNL